MSRFWTSSRRDGVFAGVTQDLTPDVADCTVELAKFRVRSRMLTSLVDEVAAGAGVLGLAGAVCARARAGAERLTARRQLRITDLGDFDVVVTRSSLVLH